MTAERVNKDGQLIVVSISRTENKNRKRPDAEKRHINNGTIKKENDRLGLINNKNLEWLSWNWRLVNDQRKFTTRR